MQLVWQNSFDQVLWLVLRTVAIYPGSILTFLLPGVNPGKKPIIQHRTCIIN
ncbi:hypothetical protein ACRRTK_019970 [Alexandromys fortis]